MFSSLHMTNFNFNVMFTLLCANAFNLDWSVYNFYGFVNISTKILKFSLKIYFTLSFLVQSQTCIIDTKERHLEKRKENWPNFYIKYGPKSKCICTVQASAHFALMFQKAVKYKVDVKYCVVIGEGTSYEIFVTFVHH